MKKTTIGIIGTKGYGVIYSGFETFVKNLVDKTSNYFYFYLFSRSNYERKASEKNNFKDITLPVVKGKYLETPVYALFSTIYSLFLSLDVILYLSVANTPFLWLQRLRKRKVLVNVDGLDWKRARWSLLGKIYLRICELISIRFSDIIIADSKYISTYYKKTHNLVNVKYIAYGADLNSKKNKTILKKFNLRGNDYFLFVGRLVPENKVEDLLQAFLKLKTNYKCVIVGEAFYEDKYKKKLLAIAKSDKRIIFTGILRDSEYTEMVKNAYCYVETKTVGGTHPSLLEAMLCAKFIIARNIPEHKEVLHDAGVYFLNSHPINDLYKKMQYYLNRPKIVKEMSQLTLKRVKKYYNWKTVINEYQNLFSNH